MSAPTKLPGQITTFYSYKGGTGRTMLLANVAWILASAGKRVLVIDWDLEAPGLHQYFHPFLIDPHLEATDGLIDMVVEYSREAVTPQEHINDANWLDRAADVRRFVAGIDWSFPDNGQLHLLPAGRQNASFSVRVNTFHWADFYERLNGGAFLELVKKKIQNDYGYDHILIDSRTGVSDTSGICTVQMPERLVVCFTASEQSIKGSAIVASSAWTQWRRLKADSKSDARQRHRIFPILMRIEGSEKHKLDAARAHVRDVFGNLPGLSENKEDYWNKAEVGYWPFYVFEEVLAVFGDRFRTETSLLAACEHVAALITDGSVKRLAPLEPWERERILTAYERRTRTANEGIVVQSQRAQSLGDERRRQEKKVHLERGQRWFLSFNLQDIVLAQGVEAALKRNDPDAVIFLAPKSLRVGGLWLPQLAQEIADATAFVLLVGEKGLSPWQTLEYYEALDRRIKQHDFPIVLVLLNGQAAPGLPYLRLLHWIVTAEPASDRSVADLMDAVAGISSPADQPWPHSAVSGSFRNDRVRGRFFLRQGSRDCGGD
jgi:hypothetical protein